jgi:hypothetical protein
MNDECNAMKNNFGRLLRYRIDILYYKDSISVLCYGSVTWTLTQTTEQMLKIFERKILRRICGRIQEEVCWCPRWNNELYRLYNVLNIVEDIKVIRLGWAGHIIRMEEGRIPKKGSEREIPYHKTSGKTKSQMGGCCAEGCIIDIRDARMEEKSGK